MKKCTLTFSGQTIFTYESRFPTLAVDADHMTRVSINALRTILNRFNHHSQYKLQEKWEVIPKSITLKKGSYKLNFINQLIHLSNYLIQATLNIK